MSELDELVPDAATVAALLDGAGYLADEGLATSLLLAVRMAQPILLEGEPGVGKTEAAKVLGRVLDTPVIRLQCYEGLSVSEALYEWNYPRQLLAIRLAESRGASLVDADLFSEEYLLAQRCPLASSRCWSPRCGGFGCTRRGGVPGDSDAARAAVRWICGRRCARPAVPARSQCSCSAAGSGRGRGSWWCSATSRARCSTTRGRCCNCCTARAGERTPRCSPSPRG